jgi:hypothetical protein
MAAETADVVSVVLYKPALGDTPFRSFETMERHLRWWRRICPTG